MIRRYHIIFLLAFLICGKLYTQWSYLPVITDDYGTGYVSGVDSWPNENKNSGDIYVGQPFFSFSDYLGWSMFDISSIPSDAIINSIELILKVKNNSSSSNFTLCISRLNVDPRNNDVSGSDIINSFNKTITYECELIGTEKTEVNIYLYSSEAIKDLQDVVSEGNKWWGVFLHEDGFDDRRAIFNGNSAPDDKRPQLAVLYTQKCNVPTDLSVSNLDQTSATLNWSDVPRAEEYEVAIRKKDSAWSYHTISTSYYDVVGLECGTDYEFMVRTNCGDSNFSEYTSVFGFTTEVCPCNMPAGLTVLNLGQSSARLDWADVSGAKGYEISFRKIDSTWSYFIVDSSYYDISDLECETDYEFSVRADCGNGNYSEYTIAYEFTTNSCPCYTPIDLTVTNIGRTSASFYWADVSGAVGYEIGIRETGSSWNYLTVSSSYYNILGLECGKTYDCIVRTNCGSGNYSEYSNEISFATKVCPCNIPAGLTVLNLDQTSARLDWADVSGAVGYEIQIRKAGASWTELTVDSSFYDVSGLDCGEDYEFTVRTYCGVENYSAYTTVYDFTTEVCPCITPTGINVSDISQTSARLDWYDVSGVEGYEIAIREAEGSWSYLTVGSSYYNVLGLNCGKDYEFIVRSNCGSGNYSSYSSEFSFSAEECPCLKPTDLSVTNLDDSYARLVWSDVPGAEEYEIAIRKKDSTWNIFTSNNNYYDVSGLHCEEDYEFAVRTRCTNGNYSSFTNLYKFTAGYCSCYFPSNLSYSGITTNEVLLDWSDVVNYSWYEIRYKPVSGIYWEYETSNSSSLSTSNLDCGTTYNWQVNTHCGENNNSIWVRGSDFATDPCSCDAPTNLVSENITTNSASLEWAPTSGTNLYDVRYKPTSATLWTYQTANTNSFTPTDLECNITYNWQVRSYCGNGSYSKWESGTDFITAVCSCDNPAGLAVISTSQTTADLDWSSILGVIGYQLRYKSKTSTSWISIDQMISRSNYSLSELTCSTSYNWEIRANCGDGNFGNWLSGNDFTTHECPCNTPQKPEITLKEISPVIYNTYRYEVQVFPEVTEYIWDITDGSATKDFDAITVTWNSLGNKSITVKSVNSCGESEVESLYVEVIEALAISDRIQNLNLIVFPNPTSDILYIRASSINKSRYNLSVVDCSGTQVMNKSIEIYNENNIISLDLSNLRHGVYILRICNEDFVRVEKIIKN